MNVNQRNLLNAAIALLGLLISVSLAFLWLNYGGGAGETPQQTVGTTLIKFPIPTGQCEVSDRTGAGAFYLKSYREIFAVGGLSVFSVHADCGELREYSAGKREGLATSG